MDRYSEMWQKSEDRSGFNEAIYWIELLMELGHFDHMKINDGHLNLIQYFCVDVFVFFAFIIIVSIWFCLKLCQYLHFQLYSQHMKQKLS